MGKGGREGSTFSDADTDRATSVDFSLATWVFRGKILLIAMGPGVEILQIYCLYASFSSQVITRPMLVGFLPK